MSIRLNVATALILAFGSGGSVGAQELAPPPASEARNLRKAFADALAEPGGKGVRKLTSLAGKLEAKYVLAGLLAALREGPELAPTASKPRKVGRKKEELREFGSTVVGYLFESGGNLYRYAVDLPEGYDPERAWPPPTGRARWSSRGAPARGSRSWAGACASWRSPAPGTTSASGSGWAKGSAG
jgi:hypothetical protein